MIIYWKKECWGGGSYRQGKKEVGKNVRGEATDETGSGLG